MKEEELKLQTMENRLRRLEFEEKRSQKMEQLANKRADNMIDSRKRHFEDMLMKKNHYFNVSMQEEKQRELNEKRRSDRKNMIRLRRIEAMTNNRQAKEDTIS